MGTVRNKEVVAKKELFFLGYKVISLENGGYMAIKGSRKVIDGTIYKIYQKVLNEV